MFSLLLVTVSSGSSSEVFLLSHDVSVISAAAMVMAVQVLTMVLMVRDHALPVVFLTGTTGSHPRENDVFIMFWIKLENAKKQRPQILGCVAL
jgi:hypothetical protein